MNSRRQFLTLAAGGLAWAEEARRDRPKQGMIVRSTRPEDLEMPLSGFGDFITPIEHFFVRTHVSVPDLRLDDWRLKVEGAVRTPLTLTMDDLRKLPPVEMVSVIECAGNGRSFYRPTVAGIQWSNGAVGNGRWRGVRLADVLKQAGVGPAALEVLFDGADVPIGTMADFQRAIPLKKALDPDTLLAFEMNGEALPAKHGFPLRAVVPGWAGDCCTKWITSIRVLDREFDGYWMKGAYRHPGKPVAPGAAVALEAMTPLTSLRVKSVIATPADGAQVQVGSNVPIRGVAWSGDAGPVTAVEVSVDNGRSWNPARLSGEKTRYGWRFWEFDWKPEAERYYSVLTRARDAAGDVQPLTQEWNPSGYAWNVVSRVGVDAVRETRAATAPVGPGETPVSPPQKFRATCLSCHDEDVIRQQRLSRAQWDREINKMTGWGANVAPDDRETLLGYLSTNFGPRP